MQVHSPVVAGPDGAHGGPGAHVGAQAAEVVAERVPQGLREGLGGHVEEQALGGAEEVDVEHQQQFRGGQFARVGEEAAGEHLEREVVGGLGEADGFEEAGGADVVVAGVDVRYADVEEGQGRPGVQGGEVAPAEGGAERDEAERAEGGCPGDAGEAVGQAAAVPEGVVGQRDEPGESGVRAPQQAAQVVVLAEERVEAAAHGGR